MLDAEADRERLRLDEHAVPVQHGEGVARAVPHGEHEVVGRDALAGREHDAAHAHGAAALRGFRRGRRKPLELDVVDARPEADLAAERDDLRTHLLDHAHQAEGSDVRTARVQDLLRRARLDELAQHLAAEVAWILHLAVELAVGEGARAALAELRVRLGVEHALPPHAEGVLGPLAHDLAALEDERPEARLREDQSREQPRRPHAHDDRPRTRRGTRVQPRRGRREAVLHVRAPLDVWIGLQAPKDLVLVPHLGIDRVHEQDRLLLARVDRPLVDLEPHEVLVGDAEPRHDRGPQRVLGVLERKAEFGDAQHGGCGRPHPFRSDAMSITKRYFTSLLSMRS